MPFREMTIAIASYQRREPLLRLLRELDRQAAADEALREGLRIVVVLDGSTDGSREAVEAASWCVPVEVRWQPNRGLAAARNVGLRAAGDGLVWFLDDDLIPSDGLLRRHRDAHEGEVPPGFVVGPCRLPPDSGAPAQLVAWWDDFYATLGETGTIDRFDRFTTANASAPASVVHAVGGYDETFTEYGLEDYELAIRLLRAGTPLRFDAEAVAWHPDVPPTSVLVARERSVGYNAARIVQLHPEVLDELFRPGPVSLPRKLLRWARLRRPGSLMAVSRAAFAVRQAADGVHARTAKRAETLSRVAAHAAGVAAADPDGTLISRVLGYPPSPGR